MACLTLYVRPWANGLRYLLENQAVAEFNFNDLKPGHFYENPAGNRVLFFQAIDPDSGRMRVDEQVWEVPIVRRGKIVRRFYVVRCYDYLNQTAR